MMGAAPGKRREDVEASHSKAQHALILAFFGKVGGITRSERADTDLTGQTRKDTGLMNRTSSYNLTEGVPNGECRLKLLSHNNTTGTLLLLSSSCGIGPTRIGAVWNDGHRR